MRQPARLLVALALLAVLPVLAACGGAGASADDPDPASALLAKAPLYVEGVVRPEGDQLDAVNGFVGKVLRTDDPARKVHELIDQALESDKATYAKDVAPWLGRRFAITATHLSADDPTFVGAIAVKDADAAKAFVVRQAKRDKAKLASYGATKYSIDPDDGTRAGVAGDFIVLGDTDAAFKAAVDQVGKDKGSLADSDAYDKATGDLPDDRLGTFYLDTKAVVAADPQLQSGPGAATARQFLDGLGPITAALTADQDTATIESHLTGKGATSNLLGTQAPGLVREAPSDSIGVLGVADVGKSARTAIQSLAGGLGGAALFGQIEQSTGINVDRDVLSWVGDAMAFVRGTTADDLNGAIVLSTTDDAKAAAALPRLVGAARQQGGVPLQPARIPGTVQAFQAQVPGAPAPVIVARTKGRVVVALGEEAARAGLQPSSTIDANGAYDRAKQATGGLDPSLILDGQKLVDLIERQAASDPDFAKAKPYLEALDTIVAGSKRDGDTLVSRYAVTVK